MAGLPIATRLSCRISSGVRQPKLGAFYLSRRKTVMQERPSPSFRRKPKSSVRYTLDSGFRRRDVKEAIRGSNSWHFQRSNQCPTGMPNLVQFGKAHHLPPTHSTHLSRQPEQNRMLGTIARGCEGSHSLSPRGRCDHRRGIRSGRWGTQRGSRSYSALPPRCGRSRFPAGRR